MNTQIFFNLNSNKNKIGCNIFNINKFYYEEFSQNESLFLDNSFNNLFSSYDWLFFEKGNSIICDYSKSNWEFIAFKLNSNTNNMESKRIKEYYWKHLKSIILNFVMIRFQQVNH